MALKIKRLINPVFIFFIICASACSDEKLTPEDEIKQYIKLVKLAVENRNHSELAHLIDEGYADHKGLNKKRLIKMTRGYFFTHQNIHLFTKIDSIVLQNKNSAFVTLHVAMAGSVITDLNSINNLRAQVYKFEIQLIKKNKWLLQQAKWHTADLKEVL